MTPFLPPHRQRRRREETQEADETRPGQDRYVVETNIRCSVRHPEISKQGNLMLSSELLNDLKGRALGAARAMQLRRYYGDPQPCSSSRLSLVQRNGGGRLRGNRCAHGNPLGFLLQRTPPNAP